MTSKLPGTTSKNICKKYLNLKVCTRHNKEVAALRVTNLSFVQIANFVLHRLLDLPDRVCTLTGHYRRVQGRLSSSRGHFGKIDDN